MRKVLRWKLSRNPQQAQKKADNFQLEPEFLSSLPKLEENHLIWLGHASFYIQYEGLKMITDPIFWSLPLVKRQAPLPVPIEAFNDLDYILISHAHRDHFDKRSIKRLLELNRNVELLGPLRMGKLVREVDENARFQEAGWYQQFETKKNIKLSFLPAVHWHRRTLFDYNEILWGSFMLNGKSSKLFFAGDSGYDRHFQEIFDTVGKQDICLLPVGAYKPSFLMKSSHMTPEEAAKAAQVLRADTLIPMHYGTFDLSDEPMGEPLSRLRQLNENKQLKSKLEVLQPGQVYRFG